MISNCGKDENGAYSGGQAGDQTGKEYWLISWYDGGWECVLRHPNAAIRNEIARLARNAANNNKIGYDQSERLTFWNQLQRSGYDPANITVPCEADCSSSTAAIIKAAGMRMNNARLASVSTSLTTFNTRAALRAAGFDCLTDAKYIKTDAYLLAGDIVLRDSGHVVINTTNGGSADLNYGAGTTSTSATTPANPATSPAAQVSETGGTTTLPTTTDVKQGDLVEIQQGATWWTGSSIPSWVLGMKWKVLSINGMRAVLGRSEDNRYNIVSPIHAGYLKVVGTKQEATPVAAQPQQTEPAGESGQASTYTVQPGDTLWGISEKWCGKGWKYTEIQKANNLKSIIIHVGQVLTLPEKE